MYLTSGTSRKLGQLLVHAARLSQTLTLPSPEKQAAGSFSHLGGILPSSPEESKQLGSRTKTLSGLAAGTWSLLLWTEGGGMWEGKPSISHTC